MSVPTTPDDGSSRTANLSDDLDHLLAQGFSRRQATALVFQRAWWRARLISECGAGATLGAKQHASERDAWATDEKAAGAS